MRLFIGIPLATESVRQLSALVTKLQTKPATGIRWTSPESWHITLLFLGNTSAEQYKCVAERLHELRLPQLRIDIEAPDIFVRAHVFFASVRGTPQLLSTQQKVVEATEPCGFAIHGRPYQPHITLARTKESRDVLSDLKKQAQGQPPFQAFTAREFLLYESFLDSAGARYEVRDRFPLESRQD